MTETPSEIISFVGGAGGAGGVLYMWIRSLIAEKKDLVQDLKDERERNNAFGEAWMKLATETKIHLEHSKEPIENLSGQVKDEHETTRAEIIQRIESQRRDG